MVNSFALHRFRRYAPITLLTVFCFLLFPPVTRSQVVYQDLTNTAVYRFIDELANLKIISVQSAVKPWSRAFIAGKLAEAAEKKEQLNKRQQKDLEFYLRDYNLELRSDLSWFKKGKGLFKKKPTFGIPLSPLEFVYKDTLFTFALRPVWGISYLFNEHGTAYHRWGGAEIFGTIGKHVGFYTNLRDNTETSILSDPAYLTQDEGAAWKPDSKGGGDYSEMRGGITFCWNWGSVALAKDHFQFGDNYHGSNILSGRTPSFPYFQLQMKPVSWFSYNFVTGWLVSGVVDESRSYNLTYGVREFYFNKFLSACMLTFTPVKRLDLSVGNSVVSCSEYYDPAYLSPLLFFFSFDHGGDSLQKTYYGQNSQLFLNVSSRQIRHLHLYGTFFLDNLDHGDLSWKAGCHVDDFPLQNLAFTAEYTQTSPGTYTSPTATLDFSSNSYLLGHYLWDDSREIFLDLGYRPFRGLDLHFSYETQLHSDDYANEAVIAGARYEFINNAYVFLNYQYRKAEKDQNYVPEMYKLTTNTVNAGFNIGF